MLIGVQTAIAQQGYSSRGFQDDASEMEAPIFWVEKQFCQPNFLLEIRILSLVLEISATKLTTNYRFIIPNYVKVGLWLNV